MTPNSTQNAQDGDAPLQNHQDPQEGYVTRRKIWKSLFQIWTAYCILPALYMYITMCEWYADCLSQSSSLHYGIPHLTLCALFYTLHTLHTAEVVQIECRRILAPNKMFTWNQLWVSRDPFSGFIISQQGFQSLPVLISALSRRFHREEHESDISLPVRLGQAEDRIKALQSCKIHINRWGHLRLDMRSEVNNCTRFSVSQHWTWPERSCRNWGVNTTKKWQKSKTLIHGGNWKHVSMLCWCWLFTVISLFLANDTTEMEHLFSTLLLLWNMKTPVYGTQNLYLLSDPKFNFSDPS